MRFPRFAWGKKRSCRSCSCDGFRRKLEGRRLRFEPLEVRQLLSTVPLYGTAGNDTVVMQLNQAEDHVVVTVNAGDPVAYELDEDIDFVFDGPGGMDSVYMYDSSAADTFYAGPDLAGLPGR